MSDRNRRSLFVVLSLAVVGLVGAYLALSNVGENLVYYWSPSEIERRGDDARGAAIRLGGQVEEGTISREEDGLTLRFQVTDGEASIPVVAETVPPAMFREGIGVVVEGEVGADGVFRTRRLMVKHDNQYQAPEEGEKPDLDSLAESLAGEVG